MFSVGAGPGSESRELQILCIWLERIGLDVPR
jgi:hypothetical protein